MSTEDIITLDVGGTVVRTLRATLTKQPGSELARIFEADSADVSPAVLQDDGSFFLDTDPAAFRVVLNFLRYNTLILQPNVPAECVQVIAETFGLESLVGLLSEQRGSWVKVNAGGREFLTTRETLTKLAASPLAAMLQPGQQQLQLDCDPREFEVILTYLRRYKTTFLGGSPCHTAFTERVSRTALELLGVHNLDPSLMQWQSEEN